MNHKLLFNTVNTFWDEKIIPVLTEYIKILRSRVRGRGRTELI